MEQVAQADQVVGDHVQNKHRSDLFGAAQFELTQSAPLLLLRRRLRLDPGKHLLDSPAERMTGRDPLLDRYVGKQGAAALPVASHLGWGVGLFSGRTSSSGNSYGTFFARTPACPSAAAFQDPTHVNIITDQTVSYFTKRPVPDGSLIDPWGLPFGQRHGFKGELLLIKQ